VNRVMQPFYFIVVFWGEEHRGYFLRYLIPSLLSPGNLPSLPRTVPHRFLIATTRQDWAAIHSDPAYQAMARIVEPLLLEIQQPVVGANKYLVMSEGHKIAAERAFADKAYGIYLTPDLVLSDGSVAALQRLAAKGSNVVLCVAMRFTSEGCMPRIEALRGAEPGAPLVLEPKTLSGIALRNMHPETLRYDWDAPYFAESPYSCFWRVPGEDGIVVHSFSWAPLLVNYATLASHQSETFDRWTLDGDYIFRNFSLDDRVHVVRDSGEICLVSFTGADERPGHLPEDLLAPRWYNCWPLIRRYWKLHSLRSVKNSGEMDPLRRRIFALSMRLHGGSTGSAAWASTEARAGAIIGKIYSDPPLLERVCGLVVRFIRVHMPWPLPLFHRAKTIAARALAVNGEYSNQSGVGSYRIGLTGPALSTGRWYWEVASPNLGNAADTAAVGVVTPEHPVVRELGSGRHGWGWRGDGKTLHGGRKTPYGSVAGGGDQVIMVALDMDAGKIWFGLNGQWFEAGDPAAGTHPAFQDITTAVFPAVSSRHGGRETANLFINVTADSWVHTPPQGFGPLTEAGMHPAMPGVRAQPTSGLFEGIRTDFVQLVKREDVARVATLAGDARAVNGDLGFANQSGIGSDRVWLIGPGVSSGRWYWEIFSPNLGAADGVIAATGTIGAVTPWHSTVSELGASKHGWGWRGDGHSVHAGLVANCGTGVVGENQVVMVALDMDAGKIWFGLNGRWFEAGDPAAGTHPAFEGLKKTVYPAISSRHGRHGTAGLFSRVTSDSWAYGPPKGFRSLTEVDGKPSGDDRDEP